MIHVFSSSVPLNIQNDFMLLGNVNSRDYYVSKNYLDSLFKRRMRLSERKSFFAELKTSGSDFFQVIELWLDVHHEKDIIHLTPEEVEEFLQLYENRENPALYVQLGEKDEHSGESVGEYLLLNSIVELISQGRN